jgi:MFS family permease
MRNGPTRTRERDRLAADGYREGMSAGSPKSPLWYVKEGWKDWPRALREPQGVRKLTLFALSALLVIFAAASRQTAGWVHLVWALALFGAFLAVGLTIGAMIADWRARRPFHEAPIGIVAGIVIMAFFGFRLLPVALVNVAGISMATATRMLIGTAVGMATVVAVVLVWAWLGRRAPHRIYLPARAPRWWFRILLWAAGITGAAVALDPGAVPRVIEQLGHVLMDI